MQYILILNDIKNISATFSKINLQINRVINKNFLEGISQVKKTGIKKFFLINLGDIKSDILFFDNSVFKYSESFNFGTHILKKDVCKVCSLSISNVEKIFSKINFNNSQLNDETLLNKEYFSGDLYRKISMKHIREIIEARLEEILDLVYLKNINLEYLQNHSTEILINIEKEISVIICRSAKGEIKNYPSVEMEFHPEANQVEYVLSPAGISKKTGPGRPDLQISYAFSK